MAQISASEQPHMKQIDLTTLNVQQLSTLKQQLDQVNFFNLLKKPKNVQPKFCFTWPYLAKSNRKLCEILFH